MDLSHLISMELRLRYIERRKHDFELLSRAILCENFEVFKVIGHQIKGNGHTFGHPELSNVGRKCEEAGMEQDRDLAEQALHEFEVWFSSIAPKSQNAIG